MTNAIKFDLSKVVPVVVPANTVEGKPHRAFHDLAIAYRLKDGEDYTTVITDDVPVSEEELYTHAMENLEKPMLKNLSDVLKEMDPDLPAMETPLWFGGNKEKCCGANCLLHKEFLEEVAAKLGGGYYILPSSIHEVLFVAMSEGFTPDTLREIVRDVNAQEVRPEDQLSDNVYVYDVNTHEMGIVH